VSKFDNFTLTKKGAVLLAKISTGQKLVFTHCAIGDGVLSGADPADLTALINPKMSLDITSVAFKTQGYAVVRTTLTNKSFTEDFRLREIGVFAQDPDEGKILYAIANAGENGDLMPAYGGSEIVEQIYDIIIAVGATPEITAVIDDSLIYATAQDLADHAADPKAHGNHLGDAYAHSNLAALHLWQAGKTYAAGDICY
jgi:phage-related tail fiber protein